MKITEEQNQRVIENLQVKWQNGCSKCGGTSMTVNNTIFKIDEYQGRNVISASSDILPALVVFCDDCGDISLISTHSLGIDI